MEGTLVQQLKAGSEMAFRGFVERYQCNVYRVTFGILGNRRDAEEIAQNVFAKIYLSIKGFDGRSSLYTWVHRTAVNECYSLLRRKRPKVVYEGDAADHSISARVQTILDTCAASGTVVLQRNLINKLLERIPELDRQLLLLRELEGYSVADIAQATGLNQKTIKERLFRARQRLAKAAAQFPPGARRTANDTR
jgi:RNA polymerase sigma-70 factor (ECF subfamily)